jgi:ubiquinone/menaquinone biosynthesis C-methylase UbiE
MFKDSSSANTAPFHSSFPERHLFTDINDILRFDAEFWEITKGLPVRTGSLFRLGGDSFNNWRIEVNSANRKQIQDKAEEFRLKDIREKENDSAIQSIETTTQGALLKNSMVRAMVHFAMQILRAKDDGAREFRVLDLASAFGQVSTALAASLYADPQMAGILSRTRFHLVDYSNAKLLRAGQKLDDYHPAAISLTPGNVDAYLAHSDERFDIVLSLCHFHKKTFLKDTLDGVHAVLARKGVLVSGDWHSMMSEHPLFVYQFLERAGVDSSRLKMFREMFGAFMDPTSHPSLNMEEVKAVSDHQNYWASVYQEILASPSTLAHKSRHYVLGAYDTTQKRMEAMEESRLITDPAKIRKAFPNMSFHQNPVMMVTGSDRATVMMGLRGKPR